MSSSKPTIVFDAVGTLIYARPTVAEIYHQCASQCGWTGSVVDLKKRFAVAFDASASSASPQYATNESEQQSRWRKIVGCVFEHVASDTVDAIFARLWHHFAQPAAWEMYPDAVAAIEHCQKQGIPWCIGSNFDARLERVVAGHALLRQAHRAFCSSQVGFDKPALEFFRGIEQELSLEPSHLTMVGDDWRLDVQAAQTAGWNGIWIDRADGNQQLHRLLVA